MGISLLRGQLGLGETQVTRLYENSFPSGQAWLRKTKSSVHISERLLSSSPFVSRRFFSNSYGDNLVGLLEVKFIEMCHSLKERHSPTSVLTHKVVHTEGRASRNLSITVSCVPSHAGSSCGFLLLGFLLLVNCVSLYLYVFLVFRAVFSL